MTKGKPTEEPVVCDICGQIVDEKPDRHDFGLVGNKLPLNGHFTCIRNVIDKIMDPNRKALNKWDSDRVRTLQRQTLDLALPIIQVRLENVIRNLETEWVESQVEEEKKERQARREIHECERFMKFRTITPERKTRVEIQLEKLRVDRKKQPTQEKLSGSNGNVE